MRRCIAGRRHERSRSPLSREPTREAPGSLGVAELPSASSTRSLASVASCGQAVPDLHVLYASPLDKRLPQINIQAEIDLLHESLQKANCSMNICVGIATTKALAQLLTLSRAVGSVVLHLSMHVVTPQQSDGSGAGLVFENGYGGAQILYRQELEDLLESSQQLDGLSLVFINGCCSESIAQLLVENGCRLVIATRGKVNDVAATTFTQQFYYALGSQESVRASFESAQKVLRVDPDPKVKASAEMFLLFGQHTARSRTLPRDAAPGRGDMDSPSSHYSLPIESSSTGLAPAFLLPSRAEDYIERSTLLCEILRSFDASGGPPRRACVLSGPKGIGKTALAVDLAHYASSPGRLFSRSVMFVPLEGTPSRASLVEGMVRCLSSRRPPLLAASASSQQEVLQAVQQLEMVRGRHLLLLDDHCGAVRASRDIRAFLSSLLESAKNLSIVICSREQVYDSLGSCKCVNHPLPGLEEVESARLFLRRMHRPLRPCDLERGDAGQGNLPRSDLVLQKLAKHPLLQELRGNPGRLRDVSQRVTPQLRSLFDLCSASSAGNALLRAMSVDETAHAGQANANSAALARGMSEESADGTQLTRNMSLDGAPLARMMSVDGAPLTRMMSIDETQAP